MSECVPPRHRRWWSVVAVSPNKCGNDHRRFYQETLQTSFKHLMTTQPVPVELILSVGGFGGGIPVWHRCLV